MRWGRAGEEPPPSASTTPGSSAASLAPVAPGERIELLDVLRGTALFGILAANMRGFAAPGGIYARPEVLFPGFADRFAQGLLDLFVSGKCVTLFSFLFGLGFAVQMSRAESRGVRPGSFYPRRLLVLLAIGVLHGMLVWWGDILVAYALMGFLLLAFRKRQPATVLRWAAGILLVIGIAMTAAFVYLQFAPRQAPELDPLPEAARVARVFNEGSPRERLDENVRTWLEWLPNDLGMLALLPSFLFGLWVWRQGIVEGLESRGEALRRVCRIALPLGLALQLFAVVATMLRRGPGPGPPGLLALARTAAGFYGQPVLALGYATGLALLVRQASWRRRLAPAAEVGRMALTNYTLQSVVGVALFTTTGLYGRVGPALLVVPTVAVFAAQVWLSGWWLRRFRFGPLEWLWRVLTYGQVGPLRRETPAQAAVSG